MTGNREKIMRSFKPVKKASDNRTPGQARSAPRKQRQRELKRRAKVLGISVRELLEMESGTGV